MVIGVVIVTFLTVVWYISPDPNDLLGVIGGVWAICRVTQFLLMKISAALGFPKSAQAHLD